MVEPAGKVGGMQQAEGRRSEALRFFSAFGGFFHELRGIPFGKEHLVAFGLQPFMQQLQLSAFARSIDAFDDDQLPWVSVGGSPE